MNNIQIMLQANADRQRQALAARLAANPEKLAELEALVAQAKNGAVQ